MNERGPGVVLAIQHRTVPGDAHQLIACIDLNGVLDDYHGWKGAGFLDPPRAGAARFLESLVGRGFRVVVFTTRWPDDVWRWLHAHQLARFVDEVTDRKPPAHVFVDDRAICFRGSFDRTLEELSRFRPHWDRPVADERAG